jgi:hypothetical protein
MPTRLWWEWPEWCCLMQCAVGASPRARAWPTSDRGEHRPSARLPASARELPPVARHVIDQYANNPIEGDHDRLKSRLRPTRGLKRLRSARVISAGHAFVQNMEGNQRATHRSNTILFRLQKNSTLDDTIDGSAGARQGI